MSEVNIRKLNKKSIEAMDEAGAKEALSQAAELVKNQDNAVETLELHNANMSESMKELQTSFEAGKAELEAAAKALEESNDEVESLQQKLKETTATIEAQEAKIANLREASAGDNFHLKKTFKDRDGQNWRFKEGRKMIVVKVEGVSQERSTEGLIEDEQIMQELVDIKSGSIEKVN